MPSAGARQVLLLRGINVGGRHSVPMAAFAGLLAELGCTHIQTYIQSGNAVITAPDGMRLSAKALAEALGRRFGFAVPVVVRTAEEWKGIVADNPLLALGTAGMHVVFLADTLSAAQGALLQATVAGEEKLVTSDRVLYLHLPEGAGRSKLALACVGPKMPGTNTMRNWATVLKLAELLDA